MMIKYLFGNYVQLKKRLRILKKLRHTLQNLKLLHKKDLHIEVLLTKRHLYQHLNLKKLLLNKKKFLKKYLKKVLLRFKMKMKTLIQMEKLKWFNHTWMFRLEKIKTLIQVQMKMKFVNKLKKMFNLPIIQMKNLNLTVKLRWFNHTCKQMFKLKMMQMKIQTLVQMKMKLELPQMFKLLMIKNLIPKWIKMNLELINQTFKYQLKLKFKH